MGIANQRIFKSVQRGTITPSGTTQSVTQSTIAPVDISKSRVELLGVVPYLDYTSMSFGTIQLINPTTVEFVMGNWQPINVTYQVTEFY
jgi:hypothetical protein